MKLRNPTPKIIEIQVHRSKKHPRLGHAVASLHPCDHKKYLGITLYKGDIDTWFYRTKNCLIIKFDDYAIMDKEPCKLCPQDEYWLDSLESSAIAGSMVEILDAIDED